MTENRYGSAFQRNALAPGIIAAVVLVLAQILVDASWVLFAVSILALIVGWFAIQARHWWWVPVFGAIAVAWNPVWPFTLEGTVWDASHYIAALAFLAAGILIKSPSTDDS